MRGRAVHLPFEDRLAMIRPKQSDLVLWLSDPSTPRGLGGSLSSERIWGLRSKQCWGRGDTNAPEKARGVWSN